jgi:hypothetical protein
MYENLSGYFIPAGDLWPEVMERLLLSAFCIDQNGLELARSP